MEEADLKLYTLWYNPYSMSVVWALKLKGIAFENIEEDRFNKVLNFYNNTTLFIRKHQCLFIWWKTNFADDEEKKKAIEKVQEQLKVVEDQCFSDEKNFFGGDTINMVDLAFGSVLKFIEALEEFNDLKVIEPGKFHHLHSWFNDFKDVQVIKENLNPNDQMVAYFKVVKEKYQTMAELKLHGFWYSPLTLRVILTLKLKGITYEYIEEDRFNKSPQLLEYNPVHKLTPVLVHHGKSICESMIIVEYVDEVWPQNPLVPHDPYDRAQARFWVAYADQMIPAVKPLFHIITDDEVREKAIERVQKHLKVIDNQCLIDQKFFNGDHINIVDIALGSVIKFLVTIEDLNQLKVMEAHKFPHLYSRFSNFKNSPIVKENIPNSEKLIACIKLMREKMYAHS
ncbi:hypothetical protein Ahy_B09g098381 [Arachis hypogaea]|uniref:glutathione transferase n=2 Tax=Arachis hypogaea TaxID=3818 RepID=A0A444XRQ7_ARAHY|nr:hypothetical protein Ahy_B09g098381 [Arachis hypogaea]